MTEREQVPQQEEGDREVDPAENPEPRGNPEPDPERVEQGKEELDRAGAN